MDSKLSHQLHSPKKLMMLASNVKFPGGNTILHYFVLDNSHPYQSGSENYINAVLLSMFDVPVNAVNDDRYTALHLAVLRNNHIMVKKLLSCFPNIDINATCDIKWEKAALHFAAELKSYSIIEELLKRGAAVNLLNFQEETPLSIVAKSGDVDLLKLLVSYGANVNMINGDRNPLCYAVKSGNLEAVTFLVSKGANIHRIYGESPLCLAAFGGHLDIVKYFVSNGVDVNFKEPGSNMTPLHYAVQSRHFEVVEFLVSNGADVNARELNMNETPLHEAVHMRYLETPETQLSRLQKYGLMAFVMDQGSDIVVDECEALKSVKMVKLLLDKGADVNVKNRLGKTALDLAREKQNQLCIDALQNVK